MIIEDVIGPGECICRTDEGRVLENVQQTMVETVIPRSDPAYVMVVGGQYQGKVSRPVSRGVGGDWSFPLIFVYYVWIGTSANVFS